MTKRQPTSSQIADLMFAWNVARFVKSNTIVYARGGMTLGVGAGQMSRVDSARIAMLKAEEAGLSLEAPWPLPTPSSRSATVSTSWWTPAARPSSSRAVHP